MAEKWIQTVGNRSGEHSRLFLLRAGLGIRGRTWSDALLRNSLYLMATTAATSLLGFVYWTLAARLYVPHDVGLASALISTMVVASLVTSSGMGTALMQRLPIREGGDARSRTLGAAVLSVALSGLLASVILAILLPRLSPDFVFAATSIAFAASFIVSVPAQSVASVLDDAFTGELAAENVLVRNVAFAILKILLLAAGALALGGGALAIFDSWVVALLTTIVVAAVLQLPRLHRGYRLVWGGIVGELRPLLSRGIGHHLISLGGAAPLYLLPIVVTIRLSPADNAYFYTTWMLGGIFFMISPAVAQALVATGAHEPGGLRRQVRSSALIIAALLVPGVAILLVGGRFLMAAFGPSYPHHGLPLLRILLVSSVPDAITNIYVAAQRVRGGLRSAALLNGSMAVGSVALACVLLPPFGIAGAGWAWLIAQSVGSIAVFAHVAALRAKRSRGPAEGGADRTATPSSETGVRVSS